MAREIDKPKYAMLASGASLKKMIGAGAIIAAAALSTGCESTPRMDLDDALSNQTTIEQVLPDKMTKAAENAKPVNIDTYENILEEQKSGVYQSPINENQIITYMFVNDKDAETNIRADLKKHDLKQESLDWHETLYDLSTSSDNTTSKHVQDPFGRHDDINLTKIQDENYIDPNKYNEDGFISMDYTEDSAKKEKYNGYSLLVHESGHADADQQMDLMDFTALPFTDKTLIKLENSSEFMAHIKTYQLMVQENESPEFIDQYFDNKIQEAKNITLKTFNGHDDYHQIIPTTQIAVDMIDAEPDFVQNISDSDLRKMSAVVSNEVVNTNYVKMYNDSNYEQRGEYATSIAEQLNDKSPEDIERFIDYAEEKNSKNDFRKPADKDSNVASLKMLHLIKDNQENLKSDDPEVVKLQIDSIVKDSLTTNERSMSLTDYDHRIANIGDDGGYKDLYSNIYSELKLSGVDMPSPDKIYLKAEVHDMNVEVANKQENSHDVKPDIKPKNKLM